MKDRIGEPGLRPIGSEIFDDIVAVLARYAAVDPPGAVAVLGELHRWSGKTLDQLARAQFPGVRSTSGRKEGRS